MLLNKQQVAGALQVLGPYSFTAAMVLGSGVVGSRVLVPGVYVAQHGSSSATGTLLRWDGRWYRSIVENGYQYASQRRSNLAFFPLYALFGTLVVRITALDPGIALLIVAHVLLLASCAALSCYLGSRNEQAENSTLYCIVAFAFWPTTFFFRMSYSESTFLFFTLLAMYLIVRRYPLAVIAVVAGLATAARPVGVALVLPLAWHVWRESGGVRVFVRRMAWVAPLACWGLIAFMLYQWVRFDEPLAFAKTQVHWHMRPLVPAAERIKALLTLEPPWSVYVPSSPAYWRNFAWGEDAVFSLQFANPIYFSLTVLLVAFGAWRRWLTVPEVLLASGLLFIPYVTRSYEMCMASQGRFAAVVFPAYIVMGRILSYLPVPVAGAFYGLCAFFLAVYAALFGAGYLLI